MLRCECLSRTHRCPGPFMTPAKNSCHLVPRAQEFLQSCSRTNMYMLHGQKLPPVTRLLCQACASARYSVTIQKAQVHKTATALNLQNLSQVLSFRSLLLSSLRPWACRGLVFHVAEHSDESRGAKLYRASSMDCSVRTGSERKTERGRKRVS